MSVDSFTNVDNGTHYSCDPGIRHAIQYSNPWETVHHRLIGGAYQRAERSKGGLTITRRYRR